MHSHGKQRILLYMLPQRLPLLYHIELLINPLHAAPSCLYVQLLALVLPSHPLI